MNSENESDFSEELSNEEINQENIKRTRTQRTSDNNYCLPENTIQEMSNFLYFKN